VHLLARMLRDEADRLRSPNERPLTELGGGSSALGVALDGADFRQCRFLRLGKRTGE
jgi:hypothetical protein